MLVTCWSVKGGSGTTVVAAALAILLARRLAEGALLVDAGGDAPCALGLPEHGAPGLADWLAAPSEIGADALDRLLVDAAPGLSLLPAAPAPSPRGPATASSPCCATGRSPWWMRAHRPRCRSTWRRRRRCRCS